MTKFWDLLERSIIVQSLVTLILISVSGYMYATGQEVPDGLQTLTVTVVAYWMGTKAQHGIEASRAQRA